MSVKNGEDVLVASVLIGEHQVGAVLDQQEQPGALGSRWEGICLDDGRHRSTAARGRDGRGRKGENDDFGAHGSPTVVLALPLGLRAAL